MKWTSRSRLARTAADRRDGGGGAGGGLTAPGQGEGAGVASSAVQQQQ